MAHTRVYCKGLLEAEDFPVADVSEHLARPDTVVWVDLCRPSKEELHELAEELGLHELAVEDALSEHQRPKLDHYASHLFLSCHAIRLNGDEGSLEVAEIDAFINKRWLITVRKDEAFSMAPVIDRWDRSPDLAIYGTSFLLYGLLDVVVDGYFETLQVFDEFYDRVSEGLFAETPLATVATAPLVPDPPGARALPQARRARCARPSAGSCDAPSRWSTRSSSRTTKTSTTTCCGSASRRMRCAT